jgi:hypothetical protein
MVATKRERSDNDDRVVCVLKMRLSICARLETTTACSGVFHYIKAVFVKCQDQAKSDSDILVHRLSLPPHAAADCLEGHWPSERP